MNAEKHFLVKEMFTNGLKQDLPVGTLFEKTIH